MRDREETALLLEEPIPSTAIVQRQSGAGMLDYVDGAYVIDTLNRIFGWDGWCFEHVDSHILQLARIDDGPHKGKWSCVASYVGTIRLTHPEGLLERAGSACGSGMSWSVGEAAHFALAEAETDALKRAARLLGGNLGLELYRKGEARLPTLRAVEDLPDAVRMFAEAIDRLQSVKEVTALANEIKAAGLKEAELAELRKRMDKKMKELVRNA